MKKTIEVELMYAPPIDSVPEKYGDIYKSACSGDGVTIDTWKKTWISNYKLSKDRFGEFASRSFGQLFGINRHKPAIIIGSGPSVRSSLDALRKNKTMPNPVMTISCLHNFGLLEDEGCHADYYLTLDSGPIVLTDVTEGRKELPEYYWEKSKEHTLLCNVASDQGLFDKWKGKIYLFNTLIPDLEIRQAYDKVERFGHFISSGGNATGGCQYTAKAIMGSSEIIYVGLDLCFDWTKSSAHFHSYPTQYDNFNGNGAGNTVNWPTIYGNSVPWAKTWPSYLNFKFWFDWVSVNIPGRWASASEGIVGAYPEGNLRTFRYGALDHLLEPYWISDVVHVAEMKIIDGKPTQILDENGIMKKAPVFLSEMFKDSKQPLDITLY